MPHHQRGPARRRRRTLTTLAAGVLALGLTVPTTAAVSAPAVAGHGPGSGHGHGHGNGNGHGNGHSAWKDSQRLRKAVTVRGMSRHLHALQGLANEYGDRAAGRPGYEAAARYVERQLRQAGYRPWRQYFDFTYEELQAASLTENSPTQRDLTVSEFTGSPNTPEGGTTADLVAPSNPLGCDADAWNGVDATGKIALVSRGECPFGQKSLAASAAGAEAVLIYNNAAGSLNGTLGEADPDFVPVGGISQEDGQTLLADLQSGAVNMTFEMRIFTETRKTFSVLAEKQGRRHHGEDDKDVVMLGAHLDSIQDGPGINDNGTGTSAMLEVARNLKRFKTPNTVRFAWWGAEENGLLGSDHYVEDLLAQDPDELDRIATYLNFDMIGSSNYIIGVYDADGSSYEPTAPVPPGSIETEQVFRDYFERIDQPVTDYQFSGRSDYQAFINNGVAAGGLSTGSNGLKSQADADLFGGQVGVSYDPNYHSPEDDLSNVSLPALDIQSDGMAHAAITLAHDTSLVEPTD